MVVLPEEVGPGHQDDAVGLLDQLVPRLEQIVGHPQLLQVELHDRAVQNSQHDALAEHGRQGRDPDVDFVAAQSELDPAVLRQPPLGDVEIRHDLDAARDRRGQVARRGHQLVEHPVDPVSHLVFFLERLEVDVRSLVLDRQEQHHVQQLAHRRGLGHLFDRLEVDRVLVAPGQRRETLVLLDLLDDVLDALVVAGIEPLDGRHHVGLGGDRPLDLGREKHLQAVERRRVLRLGHRDRQALVFLVLRDRHDLVRRRHALIDQLGELGRDRDVGQLDHLHAKLLAQGLHDLVFLDQIHAHRHLAQQLRARALLLLEHLPQGFLVEVTHVDHDCAESSRHVDRSRGPRSTA